MGEGLINTILNGVFAVFLAIGGWFINSHKEKMHSLEEKQASNQAELAIYKLESEKRFAKEDSMQFSLSRLHDRMDTISDDIKTILSKI